MQAPNESRVLRFNRTLDMDTYEGRKGAAATAQVAIQWLGGFVQMMLAGDPYSLGVPPQFDKRTKEAKDFEKAADDLFVAMKRYDSALATLQVKTRERNIGPTGGGKR